MNPNVTIIREDNNITFRHSVTGRDKAMFLNQERPCDFNPPKPRPGDGIYAMGRWRCEPWSVSIKPVWTLRNASALDGYQIGNCHLNQPYIYAKGVTVAERERIITETAVRFGKLQDQVAGRQKLSDAEINWPPMLQRCA